MKFILKCKNYILILLNMHLGSVIVVVIVLREFLDSFEEGNKQGKDMYQWFCPKLFVY